MSQCLSILRRPLIIGTTNPELPTAARAREAETCDCAWDITAIKGIIQEWRIESKNKQERPNFDTSMTPTIKGGHLFIAAYLVESVTIALQFPWNFQIAMNKKSYDFIKLFLHHGFDINRSWSEYYSTPLAIREWRDDSMAL